MTAVPVEITTQPTTTDIELVDDLDELVESSKCSHVVTTDDPWEPWRLVDGDGVVVESVAAYLRDLQAAGRSTTTARSYALDLLRWFLWAVGVGWDRGTQAETRDFCRWLQVAGKPTRAHWRHRGEPQPAGARLSGRRSGVEAGSCVISRLPLRTTVINPRPASTPPWVTDSSSLALAPVRRRTRRTPDPGVSSAGRRSR